MDIFRSLIRGPDGITALSVYYMILRITMPVMAMIVLVRCGRSFLGFRREPEVWAWLRMPTGDLLPVTHWENLIGRKKTADIVLDVATVSKNHAVLTRQDDGTWTVTSIGGKGRLEVNGTQVMTGRVDYGDTISLAGLELTLEPVSREEARLQALYAKELALSLGVPSIDLYSRQLAGETDMSGWSGRSSSHLGTPSDVARSWVVAQTAAALSAMKGKRP